MAKDPAGKGKAKPPRKRARPGRGAGLCYGEPIHEGGRTIIPVARVHRTGGTIDAVPRGYIEVGPEGTRFQPIDDPDAVQRRLKSAATAALALAGAVAGLRAARSMRAATSRRLLGRGS